jgi:hypothetical protein
VQRARRPENPSKDIAASRSPASCIVSLGRANGSGEETNRSRKEKASKAHRMGALRSSVRWWLGSESTRPEGWVMMFIARGMSVQKAVCYDTVMRDEAVGYSQPRRL